MNIPTQSMTSAQPLETTQVSFMIDTTFALKAWWDTVGLGIVFELIKALSPKTTDKARRVEWSVVLYRSHMPYSDFLYQAIEVGTDPKRLSTVLQGIKFEGGHVLHHAWTEACCSATHTLTRNTGNKRVVARHVIAVCSAGPIGINCSAPGCKYLDTWHEHVTRLCKELGAKLSLLSLANTDDLRLMLKMIRPNDAFTELKGAYASFDPSIELPSTLLPQHAPNALAAKTVPHMPNVAINSAGNPVLANSGNTILGQAGHMTRVPGAVPNFQPTPTFMPGNSGPMMTSYPPQPAPSKFPEIKPRPVTNSPGMIRRSNTPTPQQGAPVSLVKSGGVMHAGQPLYGNNPALARPALGGDLLAAYPAQAVRAVWIGNLRLNTQPVSLACRVQALPANQKSPADSTSELSLGEWNSDLFIAQFVPLETVKRLTGAPTPRIIVRFVPHEMQDKPAYIEMVNQFKSGVFGLVELQTKVLLIGLATGSRSFMGLVVPREAWLRAQQATNQSQANLALASSNLGGAPNPGMAAQYRPALNQGQYQGQPYFGNAPNFSPAAAKQPPAQYGMNPNLGNINYGRPNFQ